MNPYSVRIAAAAVLVALFLSLTGCRGEVPPASAASVLLAMCETLPVSGQPEGDATAGDTQGMGGVALYTRSGDPAGGGFLSETLFSALFGEAARGLLSQATDTPDAAASATVAVNDAAVCLSVMPTPVEMAVLRCSDERGAATAAGLCQTRLDALRRAWAGTECAGLVEGGRVIVAGSYVLLVVTPNPERAEDAAKRVIRRGG